MKEWFVASREGLRELWAGKPKSFILRELLQNALDEDVRDINVGIYKQGRTIQIEVEDDSPEGFRDISHAFTLFAPTYKRSDPEKRGRFNLGEKQVLALCTYALIQTTKGTLEFSSEGRKNLRNERVQGSLIRVEFPGTYDEFDEIIKDLESYLIPKHVSVHVETRRSRDTLCKRFTLQWKKAFKGFMVKSLPTELLDAESGVKRTRRNCLVQIHKPRPLEVARLYEMGLPVCEIDCDYHIDVQQKVPLAADRETVPQSYLKQLYAEVLNHTYEEITDDNVSSSWVRTATSAKEVGQEAVKEVIRKRFGDRVAVATPGNDRANDDALADGYKILRGKEMSSEEWENIKRFSPISSTASLFPRGIATSTSVELTNGMKTTARLTKLIARSVLGIEVRVNFLEWDNGPMAQYGNRTLDFNVKACGRSFFKDPLDARLLSLIIHELGHECGHHTERSYHDALTKIGAWMTRTALLNPKVFEDVLGGNLSVYADVLEALA